ncbi:FAD-binding and (Fe-S)-binding domain-containing protein [Denitrobaculum tricleocarpae]|uniref:FAD-binding protein n=1 Tax=Denitrobaculum tricleocarpae TaxID=2591009 RepID=A0A545TWM2_9PROT|nr:FAD-binding and (Fe-S)-binding domain-containing protein [Denitrobaculum tricleocarpae]TQV81613.1 FAD-binding protein [Denitrobaculum tricleocarpae]
MTNNLTQAPKLDSSLQRRLALEIQGATHFDPFSLGRYATDASVYQMMPLGVIVPQNLEDVRKSFAIARDAGVPVLPRGGGTSQCGQTVNNALVIDTSRHLNKLLELDVENRRCVVEPGIVLDHLNAALKPHGLWFPVDVSTSSRATIGGMTGNNSCGSRSIRYGTMRDNVDAIDALLADGTPLHFGPVAPDLATANKASPEHDLFRDLLALGAREAEEIRQRFPDVARRVGGYNIDALVPANGIPGNGAALNGETAGGNNLSHLLVGSEGTLAYSTRIELRLSPLPQTKVLGVCHFASFYEAMDATQHLVSLDPAFVELVDRTMIDLARDVAMYRPTIEGVVRGNPEALLLVEFAGDDQNENLRRLKELGERMGDLGFAWNEDGKHWGGVVEITNPSEQSALMEVRKAGLNIMMSMKSEGKPISFVEDCAVRLTDLAEYTARLTAIFDKHGTRGTWYAHASVGCLHVRPVLNLKLDEDLRKMRAIAEEAFDMVAEYKGSHSGEHGDGIVRSEHHERMFGTRMIRSFEEVKDRLDPEGLLNPGKIVRAPKMDERALLRYGADYKEADFRSLLDWSAYPGAAGGFQGAVEMCNNNGACRKLDAGVMCPSYRVTKDERDSVRGRANSLRLALSGQLGPDALTSDDMIETLKLCVACKGCKRECPTGVDMSKMKTEVLAARIGKQGLGLHDRLVAYLPRYASYASKAPWLPNLRDRIPGLAKVMEGVTGFSAKRKLPKWRSDSFDERAAGMTGEAAPEPDKREVVLLADTFNRYFEPENLHAALAVLSAGGYKVLFAQAADSKRPLCCGRTFLSVGLIKEAEIEAERVIDALLPFVERGVPIVGLEPSCLLTLRDEYGALFPGDSIRQGQVAKIASQAVLLEEFLSREMESGDLNLDLKPVAEKAFLHGHCHQKAFAALTPVQRVLGLIPDLKVETIESSCCGMAGAFGYGTETYDTSLQMAELSLLPKVREAAPDDLVIADGTSCRHQIADGSQRKAQHVAQILKSALR